MAVGNFKSQDLRFLGLLAERFLPLRGEIRRRPRPSDQIAVSESHDKVRTMLDTSTAGTFEPPSPAARLAAHCRPLLHAVGELLERNRYVFLLLASLGYFSVTIYRAQHQLFWFDEIFTFYIARLPNIASIWNACMHGVDFNPPLLYLLTRWSQGIFGVNELGTRMPEVVGFWVFCLCLYRFTSLRANALAGFIALLLPLTTGGYWYAYDARSYGVVLGFFGLALISWQAAATRGPRQWASVAGLAASLSSAALCHCYAFLLFIPLGCGELARTIIRKRFDAAVWGALLLPAVVSVATVLPLVRSVHTHLGTWWPSFNDLWTGWDLSLPAGFARGRTILVMERSERILTQWFSLLLVALIGASALSLSSLTIKRKDGSAGWSFTSYETVALLAALFTPVIAFVSARLAHAPLYGRYSLIVVAGIACLVGAACKRSTAGVLVLGMTVLLIMGQFAVFYFGNTVIEPAGGSRIGKLPASNSFPFQMITDAASGGEPIALLDDWEFAPMFYYAPPSLQSRLVALTPALNPENYLRLQRCCGALGAISSQPDFLNAHPSFFVYSQEDKLLSKMESFGLQHGQITDQSCQGGHCLLRVTFPSPLSETRQGLSSAQNITPH